MDDKIKVSLELDTSQVEPKVNTAQKLLNAIKTTLGNISKTGIKPQIDTKQAEARIKYLKQKIEDMQKSKIYGGMIVDENALSNATKELNYWQDAMKDVSSETDNVSDEMEEVEKHTEKVHKKAGLIQRAFSRVGISLRNQISTSLAHMINPLTAARKVVDIMRQSFEYLTNTITPRLGASFSNIKNNFFEYIATSDLFQNLVNGAIRAIYIVQELFNKLAKLLGFRQLDLFKTSMKTAKQLQKMQSQMVAGFDEINDIGGGNQNAQLDATPLGMDALLGDTSSLNNLADKFAEVFSKIYEIVMPIIEPIWKIITSIGDSLYNWVISDNFSSMLNSLIKILSDIWKWVVDIFDWVSEIYQSSIKPILDELLIFIGNIITVIGDIWNILSPIVTNIIKLIKDMLTPVIEGITGVIKGIIKACNGVLEFISGVFTGDWKKAWNGIKKIFTGIWDACWSALKGIINTILTGVEKMINTCIKGLNKLLTPLREVGNAILKAVGVDSFSFNEIKEVKLNKLATGTNYVPNDQLAMIHQGEAVIPKKFNDRTFFGGGNEETISLLEDVLSEIRNIDFSPYTTIKDVGKASVEYIKDTSRQLGKSVI